jgi:hypothetical protein
MMDRIHDQMRKLIVSRWTGVSLLVEELVVSAKYQQSLVQVLSLQDEIDVVITGLNDYAHDIRPYLGDKVLSDQELDATTKARALWDRVGELTENFKPTMLGELKEAMTRALQSLESAIEFMKRKPGQLFILRRQNEPAWPSYKWPKAVQLVSEIICHGDILYICLQTDSPNERNTLMEKVQHTCSTSSLHIIRTLNIKNTGE